MASGGCNFHAYVFLEILNTKTSQKLTEDSGINALTEAWFRIQVFGERNAVERLFSMLKENKDSGTDFP